MTRRKRPPEGRSFAVSTFRDPASWLPGFITYLDAECGMAQNTLVAYRHDLERFFAWNRDTGKVGIHDIGVPTITAFLDFLQNLGLAASSVGRNLVAVRMYFRFLMLEGVVAESTVDLVSSPKLWERLPKVLSPEMVDALLMAPIGSVDRYYLRDRALLAVMYATGCRVSEVVGLKQQDVQLAENYCMRPDRIIIGECRGGETLDMLQAMNTGHDGSMTTVHANNPRDAISRIETLVNMSGCDLPLTAVRKQIAAAVHLIIQANRLQGGPRKVTYITEIVGMEGDTIVMQDIFKFQQDGIGENGKAFGHFESTGVRPKCIEHLETGGVRLPNGLFAQRTMRSP